MLVRSYRGDVVIRQATQDVLRWPAKVLTGRWTEQGTGELRPSTLPMVEDFEGPAFVFMTSQTTDGTALVTWGGVSALVYYAEMAALAVGGEWEISPVHLGFTYDHPTHPTRQREDIGIAVRPRTPQ